MKKRFDKIIIPALITSLLLVCNSFLCQSANCENLNYFHSIVKHVQYGYTIQNKTAKAVKDARFMTYAPLAQTSGQYCSEIVSSHPYIMKMDSSGNRIMEFDFDTVPPHATYAISIRAKLKMAVNAVPIDLINPNLCLDSGRYIESEDPGISKRANLLKAMGNLETAKRIFRYITANVQYSGYSGKARGARYAFYNKRGDCTEFMYLFVALCRAAGIPSRGIGGYVLSKSGKLTPSGYHNWAEFYHEGSWQIADPQRKIFMNNIDAYIAMRVVNQASHNHKPSFSRFAIEGNGLSVKMNN